MTIAQPPNEAAAANRAGLARTRSLFLRAVGVVYLAAFLSLRWQVLGLFGADGLLPASALLERAGEMLGPGVARWTELPTVLWLGASDAALHGACVAGAVAALLVVLGLVPLPALVVCWILYLSLVGVGQLLLSYQWDALLLETGVLAILWAPLAWRLDSADGREPSRVVLWLLRWLVFRLMFFSGFVKLASGDPTWWSLSALEVHYETQPIPSWTSWWAHQLPAFVQKASCALMFVIELVLPFLIVFGRRARLVAFVGLVLLQVAIGATGNYGFFNLLSVVLCLSLLDDGFLGRVWPRRFRRASADARRPASRATPASARRAGRAARLVVDVAAAALLLALTMPPAVTQLTGLPRVGLSLQRALAPFHLAGSYGLFAVMTTRRPELTIEGTADGTTWRPYVFRWKPGPLDRRPPILGLEMPRLDWQMWFDALYVERMLETGRQSRSLITPALLARLRERSPSVLALLDGDPLDGAAPIALRWRLDLYRFTNRAERAASGDWWARTLLHEQAVP